MVYMLLIIILRQNERLSLVSDTCLEIVIFSFHLHKKKLLFLMAIQQMIGPDEICMSSKYAINKILLNQ